eukprot:869944-Pelagomonas_calceolata.AAC.1
MSCRQSAVKKLVWGPAMPGDKNNNQNGVGCCTLRLVLQPMQAHIPPAPPISMASHSALTEYSDPRSSGNNDNSYTNEWCLCCLRLPQNPAHFLKTAVLTLPGDQHTSPMQAHTHTPVDTPLLRPHPWPPQCTVRSLSRASA